MKVQFNQKLIPLVKIHQNTGQIKGVPKNPRYTKEHRFSALIKSIADDPGMLKLREVIVIPYAGEFVAIGGNMRTRAATEVANMNENDFDKIVEQKRKLSAFDDWFQEISFLREKKSIPCKIIAQDTPPELIRAIMIKDNNSTGLNDMDILANEFDLSELEGLGFDTSFLDMGDDKKDGGSSSNSGKKSYVKLVIEFEDLKHLDEARQQISDLLHQWPNAIIRK